MTTKHQIAGLLALCSADADMHAKAALAVTWFERTARQVMSSSADTPHKAADIQAAREQLANRLRNILQPITSDPITGVVVEAQESSS